MKTLSYILLCLLISVYNNYGQTGSTFKVRKYYHGLVAVSAEKMNVFYIGVPNPVSIAVAGLFPEQIEPQISANGEIIYDAKTGRATVIVNGGNETSVQLYNKSGKQKKLIDEIKFRIKRIPDPVASVFGKKEGSISKGELIAAGCILAKLENFDFEMKVNIMSFSFSTIQKGEYKEYNCLGNKFSPEIIRAIELAKGRVVFENIKACLPDGTCRTLPVLFYKIT